MDMTRRTLWLPLPLPECASLLLCLWYASAALLATAVLYSYMDRNNHGRRRRLPPGPRGWPIVGSLAQLGANPHQTLAAMAVKYGPLMSVRLGTQVAVVASSPETAEQILKTHDGALAGRHISDAGQGNKNAHKALLNMSLGPRFRHYRKMATAHLFSAQKLDSLQHLRAQQLGPTMCHVLDSADAGALVEIRRCAFAWTSNLMAATLFGAEIFDRRGTELADFQAAVIEVMAALGSQNVSDFLPLLRPLDLQRVRRRSRAAFEKLQATLEPLLQEHLAQPPEHGPDVLGAVLGDSEGPEDVAAFIDAMFVAGTDTVTVTAEWAMAELMRSPEIMAECHAEMDRVVGRQRRVTEADAERLPYLNAVIKATYRLHPAAPLLIPHRAMEDAEVHGYAVPKNSRVLVNAWAIGRDPLVWEKPETFDPERFLRRPEIDYRGQHFELIPFGSGRRICLGMLMASRMVFLLVASLVQGFQWRLPLGMCPADVVMKERFSLALGMDVPLRLLASPRLPRHLY